MQRKESVEPITELVSNAAGVGQFPRACDLVPEERVEKRQKVIQLYQVREVLEELAARLNATVALTAPRRSRLAGIQAALDDAERDGNHELFVKLDREYHLFIKNAASNGLLQWHLELLSIHFDAYFTAEPLQPVTQTELAVSNAAHRLITDAILRGDSESAASVMRRHVAEELNRVVSRDDRFFVVEEEKPF